MTHACTRAKGSLDGPPHMIKHYTQRLSHGAASSGHEAAVPRPLLRQERGAAVQRHPTAESARLARMGHLWGGHNSNMLSTYAPRLEFSDEQGHHRKAITTSTTIGQPTMERKQTGDPGMVSLTILASNHKFRLHERHWKPL
jgi:hypothetical protein